MGGIDGARPIAGTPTAAPAAATSPGGAPAVDGRTSDGHDISHPCALVRPEEMTAVIAGATPNEQPPAKFSTGGIYYSCVYQVGGHPGIQVAATDTAPGTATPKVILGQVLGLMHATNIHEITDLPDAAAATYTLTDGSQRLIICKNEHGQLRFGYLIAGDAHYTASLPTVGRLLNASL